MVASVYYVNVFSNEDLTMNPLLGIALSIELFTESQDFYLTRPKSLCEYPPGYSRYCSDAREPLTLEGASTNFGASSTSSTST